ncbi:MAG: methyltransferase domain-containing protein [Geodermatophilaceae bacterium]|nr:methyltransferase domain-containing protein [Geodermatophilaceae bacterium]
MTFYGDTIKETRLSPVEVYARALTTRRCRAVDEAGREHGLGVTRLLEPASRADDVLLAHCTRNTLDVGCGPGRLSAAITATGVSALGIDVSAVAVHMARQRGATALRRDVFSSVPGQGRWPTLLLADGNIGIGGDPVALLRRVVTILAPGGRAVVEVDPPGEGVSSRMIRLEVDELVSTWFPWARVAADSIGDLAEQAGLVFGGLDPRGERWVALLDRRLP